MLQELVVQDDTNKSFSFSVASSGAEGSSLECLRMTGRACSASRDSRVGGTERPRPQLQALGLLTTRMTVKANNDVFGRTYANFIKAEESRRKDPRYDNWYLYFSCNMIVLNVVVVSTVIYSYKSFFLSPFFLCRCASKFFELCGRRD